MDDVAQHSPLVAEEQQRRQQFHQLAALGLEALERLQSRQLNDAAWIAAQNQILADAAKHTELVDFVILKPLQQLVEATKQ